MNKIHFFNQMGDDEHSLERRRFLIKGALVPLIPMAAILPGAMSMNAVASSGVTTLLILKNSTRFNGVGQDPLLAMQHLGNGYRIYNSTLMRFQTMDSLSPFNEGGAHSYAYVSNDPVNQIDPSGHMGIMAIIGFVGLGLAVVGTALAITANVVSNNQKNYAESLKPESGWTPQFDWSEYDAVMQSANDWGVASTVGIVTAAVGGVLLMIGGGAATKSVAKGAKSAAKSVGKSISKTTSKMFKKKTPSPPPPSRRNTYVSIDSQYASLTRQPNSLNHTSNTPNTTTQVRFSIYETDFGVI